MTYQEALRYLYSFVSYEQKVHWTYSNKTLNLDRFRNFLQSLGSPQDGFKSIHVAGSDGKGSVCAMVAAVLQNRGYRVGVFSSPHLHDIRERIAINGAWISKPDFSRWTRFLKNAAESKSPLPQGYVTFFELITAMAFLYFKQKKVDFAVIETGLGGRLDTTNVMHPCVTVITHISLEHTEQLGDTLEAIADEKLGITRPDVPVIIGHQDSSLLPHFQNRLNDQSVPFILADHHYRIIDHRRGKRYRSIKIEKQGNDSLVRHVHIPLFGYYQLENTVTAIATLDNLIQTGTIPSISPSNLDRGLRCTQWPGRFEILHFPDQPILILDVAHTAKGAASLRLSLDEQFPHPKRVLIMGFLQGKKIREMVGTLLRPTDSIIFTEAPTPRSASLEMIRDLTKGLPEKCERVLWIKNPMHALNQARKLATPKDVLCITGSLYLVGKLREKIIPPNVLSGR